MQAVQYVQDNPDEVCPAGWKPGEKTMKPDTKLSKGYFVAIGEARNFNPQCQGLQ